VPFTSISKREGEKGAVRTGTRKKCWGNQEDRRKPGPEIGGKKKEKRDLRGKDDPLRAYLETLQKKKGKLSSLPKEKRKGDLCSGMNRKGNSAEKGGGSLLERKKGRKERGEPS